MANAWLQSLLPYGDPGMEIKLEMSEGSEYFLMCLDNENTQLLPSTTHYSFRANFRARQ